MRPLHECQLYAFVDTIYLRRRAPEVVAQQLCDGGADLIQLRAKESPPEEVRRLAEAILPVTRRAGIGLVINDHLSVAKEVGAEFCHLGQEDFFGGYDHGRQAGVVQISNHHVSPGKKFFEWGNGPEGDTWTKMLTDSARSESMPRLAVPIHTCPSAE